MKTRAYVEIGARVVDPASRRDKAGSIFIDAGRIVALDKAPDGFRADETIDAKGLVACPGPGGPLRAPARAGLRIQGDARIGAPRRGGGRRHHARLPARHRSAARRAGPGRDAHAPRREPRPRARVSARRAHRGPEGRAARRDGRARRGGLRRLLPGQRAAARSAPRCCRRCTTRRRSASPCGCARRMRASPPAASRTRAKSPRAWACRRSR